MRVPVGRRFRPAESPAMKAARALSLASRESQRELEGRVQRTDAGAEFVGRIRRIGRKKP